MIHLDTHVALWLHAGETERFPAAAVEHMDGNDLAISPIVALEIDYLHEIGRVLASGQTIATSLTRQYGIEIALEPFPLVVQCAAPLSWTRDPFDRLIVAQAIAAGVPLLTRDEHIHAHFGAAIWG